jgi:hypothetical protein
MGFREARAGLAVVRYQDLVLFLYVVELDANFGVDVGNRGLLVVLHALLIQILG